MRYITLFAMLACMLGSVALADQDQKYTGPLSASEKTFLGSVTSDLTKRFPTAADAEKAGYVRYTNPDETGAISYANMHWNATNPADPSQLWYDKAGNLMGADFSVPYTKGDPRPNLFGVNPGRWYEFDDHVHYVLRDPMSGKMTYGKYVMAKPYKQASGDPAHPAAADLVKMGKIQDSAEVSTIFDMPSIWDLIVWVKPNPSGAFAERNPDVKL
jgi:hypothetical protein